MAVFTFCEFVYAVTGEHPRFGAMDVCPFIPVQGVTMAECVTCAKELGHLLASELDIPVFLYGAAASRDYRKTVSQIRAGEYEALANRVSWYTVRPRYVCSTRSWLSTCCPRHSVMLPAETSEMIKRLLTLFLAKLRYNAEAIFKTYELFIYGNIQYVTN